MIINLQLTQLKQRKLTNNFIPQNSKEFNLAP